MLSRTNDIHVYKVRRIHLARLTLFSPLSLSIFDKMQTFNWIFYQSLLHSARMLATTIAFRSYIPKITVHTYKPEPLYTAKSIAMYVIFLTSRHQHESITVRTAWTFCYSSSAHWLKGGSKRERERTRERGKERIRRINTVTCQRNKTFFMLDEKKIVF